MSWKLLFMSKNIPKFELIFLLLLPDKRYSEDEQQNLDDFEKAVAIKLPEDDDVDERMNE